MSNDRNCRPLVAASRKYPHHSRCEVELDADVSRLFAPLDDVRRLSAHMEKPSLMMAGAIMHVETDVFEGDGSRFLATHDRARAWYEPGGKGDCHRKGGPLSENLGDTGSAASAGHRRFTITPLGHRLRLLVFIDYQLPQNGVPTALGMLVGRAYAAWWTRRMAVDAGAAIVPWLFGLVCFVAAGQNSDSQALVPLCLAGQPDRPTDA